MNKKILSGAWACALAAWPLKTCSAQAFSEMAFGASLLGVSQAVQQAQKAQQNARRGTPSRFQPLKSSAQGGASPQGDAEWDIEIESSVEILDKVSKGLAQALREFYDDQGEKPPANFKVYKYVYKISNKGKSEMQLNFSEWKFIHSPFTEVIQGFQLAVPAGKTRTVAFTSIQQPSFLTSPMNVGIKNKDGKKFFYGGAGMAGLYYPDGYAPFSPEP